MSNVGRHNDEYVYEPVNTWLQSTEEGLRFHRSMDDDDVYDGPLDMASFGRPVVGPLSEDERWLVNPLTYDPTRPPRTQQAETQDDAILVPLSLATPTSEPAPLGDHAAPDATITTDIDLGFLTELGQAVSRGSEDLHRR